MQQKIIEEIINPVKADYYTQKLFLRSFFYLKCIRVFT